MNELNIDENIIKKIFKFAKTTKWKDSTADDVVLLAAKKALNTILKTKFLASCELIRLCGQSGSGKTTQILPAVKSALNPKKYVYLSVRDFVVYHPIYEDLKEDIQNLRERTNGFALKVLAFVLFALINLKASIVLEMTLLSPFFEKLLLNNLVKNKYKQTFLILGVSKKISNSFILKRCNSSTTECKRVVKTDSINYFYKNLNRSLFMLSRRQKASRAIVWTAGHKPPLFDGKLQKAPAFVREARKTTALSHNEAKLLSAKTDYLAEYL